MMYVYSRYPGKIKNSIVGEVILKQDILRSSPREERFNPLLEEPMSLK